MATKLLGSTWDERRMRWLRLFGHRHAQPIYYLLPTVIPLLLLTLYPFLRGLWLAFTGYDLYKKDASFVGVANFTALLTNDTLFWSALRNNLIWTVGVVGITYLLGAITALALNERLPFRTMFRGIALIPWVCPPVVTALTWRLIYDPNIGFLNYYLARFGLIDRPVAWLSTGTNAMFAAIIMEVWKLLPFMIVMLLAGLQAVPEDLYEAAGIDGAGSLGTLRYITIPLLNRIGSIALLLSTISIFNTFDSMFVLTGGGPGNSTMLLSLMAYQFAFRYFQIGYASAIGVVMLLILIVPLTLYIKRLFEDA